MIQAHIHAQLGGPCRLRTSVPVTVYSGGQSVVTPQVAPEVIEFATTAAGEYLVEAISP